MKKYIIVSYYNSMEVANRFETNSPQTALNKWFEYSLKRPMMACIMCGSGDDCMKLYNCFVTESNIWKTRYWINKRFYMKFDYLYDKCKRYIMGFDKLYFSGNSMFYDQIPLFGLG